LSLDVMPMEALSLPLGRQRRKHDASQLQFDINTFIHSRINSRSHSSRICKAPYLALKEFSQLVEEVIVSQNKNICIRFCPRHGASPCSQRWNWAPVIVGLGV